MEDIEIQRIKERVTKWQSILILNKIVSYEELLMSLVVQQEALTKLHMEKGIFTKEEFFEMEKVVDRGMKRKGKITIFC